MATIDQFAIPQGWKIGTWQPGLTVGPLPQNLFTEGGTLLIGTVPGAQACNLAWLAKDGTWCSMADLPFDATTGSLIAATLIKVSVGGKSFIDCNRVTLEIDAAGGLTGRLFTNEGDGTLGTFQADAHPSADGSAYTR